MSYWRTIDTAPTDGTEVLVYVPRRRAGPMICVARNVTGKQWWAKFGSGAVDAKYWMPLPPPPIEPAPVVQRTISG